MFIKNKSIKIFSTSNHCFQAKMNHLSILAFIVHYSYIAFPAVWYLILMAPIHCRASDVSPNFSISVQMKKQTHLHLVLPEGEYISENVHFWVNYSLKKWLTNTIQLSVIHALYCINKEQIDILIYKFSLLFKPLLHFNAGIYSRFIRYALFNSPFFYNLLSFFLGLAVLFNTLHLWVAGVWGLL